MQVKCEEGYELSCPSINLNCSFITCQDNLLWSSELPLCISTISNCNIEQTSDVTTNKKEYRPGEKIVFQCLQPNYILSGFIIN